MKYFALLLCVVLSACSSTGRNGSSSTSEPSSPSSSGDPAADIGNSFNVGAPRTVREKKAEPNQFFFKECSDSGNDTYYSKTSYYCN